MDTSNASLLLLANRGAAPIVGIICCVLALVMIFLWRRATKRKRLIEDVPTSKVKGVAIGLTEVKGAARKREPFVSYLAGARCVWYRYEVEEHWERTTTETYTDSDGKTKTRTKTESGWKTVREDEARDRFFLEDDTGTLRIDPTRAKMEGNKVFSETCRRSDALYYDKGPTSAIANSTGKRRFTEYAVPIDHALYVMGTARVRDDAVAVEIAYDEDAPMYLISTRSEEKIVSGYGIWSVVYAIVGLLSATFGTGLLVAAQTGKGAGEPVVLLAGGGALLLYVLVLSALFAMLMYNGLIRVRERIGKAWSLIEVQLKRRADLIPRLASIVKAYSDHEKEVQEKVAEQRAGAMSGRARTPGSGEVDQAKRVADGQTAVLGSILAIVEDYPDLKASEMYLNLQKDLADTEDRIALARGFYNDTVTAYNERIATLPDVAFAKLMSLGRVPQYEIQAFERRPVQVDLSLPEDEVTASGGSSGG